MKEERLKKELQTLKRHLPKEDWDLLSIEDNDHIYFGEMEVGGSIENAHELMTRKELSQRYAVMANWAVAILFGNLPTNDVKSAACQKILSKAAKLVPGIPNVLKKMAA